MEIHLRYHELTCSHLSDEQICSQLSRIQTFCREKFPFVKRTHVSYDSFLSDGELVVVVGGDTCYDLTNHSTLVNKMLCGSNNSLWNGYVPCRLKETKFLNDVELKLSIFPIPHTGFEIHASVVGDYNLVEDVKTDNFFSGMVVDVDWDLNDPVEGRKYIRICYQGNLEPKEITDEIKNFLDFKKWRPESTYSIEVEDIKVYKSYSNFF